MFWLAIHGGGLELALGQTGAGSFIETFETRAFFDFRLHDLAIYADQKTQGHCAFFFHAPRGAGVFGFFTLGHVHVGGGPSRGRRLG